MERDCYGFHIVHPDIVDLGSASASVLYKLLLLLTGQQELLYSKHGKEMFSNLFSPDC